MPRRRLFDVGIRGMHGLLPRVGHKPVFILSEWASPGESCPESLHPWRYSEPVKTALYDPALSGGFGVDNLKKYCINNSVILSNVLQQPSPKELVHHGVHSVVGVYTYPYSQEGKTSDGAGTASGGAGKTSDGRSTITLHQALLKTAHCRNSDHSNFLQGKEIFSKQFMTLTESNRRKVLSSSLVINSHHIIEWEETLQIRL